VPQLDILTANDTPGCYADSWYSATATTLPVQPPAEGQLRCDVCVVGGGYTGVSTALHLAGKGYKVILLEANRIGWGASGRNGGQVGTGMRMDQDDLEVRFGVPRAHELWSLALSSQQKVRQLIKQYSIDCDYTRGVLYPDHRARFVDSSRRYAEFLNNNYDYEAITFLDRAAMQEQTGSDAYYGGTLDTGAAHLHPLNYCLGLAQAALDAGVRVFEGSRVESIGNGEPALVSTGNAEITADYVVVGCNGYSGQLLPQVATRVMPINNFIIATEPLDQHASAVLPNNYAVADSRFVVNYFRRSSDGRLLFGGGENYRHRFPSDIEALVRKPFTQIYPQLCGVRFDYRWGGTLAVTMNRLPHFCRTRPNIYSAGGYSGHGVAMATMAGSIIAEAIDGQASRFDLLGSLPSPRFPGGRLARSPLLALGMLWYAFRDRL